MKRQILLFIMLSLWGCAEAIDIPPSYSDPSTSVVEELPEYIEEPDVIIQIIEVDDVMIEPPVIENETDEAEILFTTTLPEGAYETNPPTNCRPINVASFDPSQFRKPQSTNVLYPDLIIPCDESDFLYITTKNSNESYHTFIAHYPNEVQFDIRVDTFFTYDEAVQHALEYGYTFGQIPFILRHNFERLILKPGDGHPYSGQEIKTYIDLRIHVMGVKEENLMHDLAHASLNGSNGLLNRRKWTQAMQADGTYPSLYAKNYRDPYEEDAPEVIIYYLISRWRPERFDPTLVDFLNQRFFNRFVLLDELEWNFNN